MVTSDYDHLLPIELAAAQERARLAAQWPVAAVVSKAIDPTREGVRSVATELRRQWRLLAVFTDPPSSQYRYPTWQFREDGQPISELHDILTVMREKGPFITDDQGRSTGWGEVEWFMTRHVLLDGATPEEMLRTDPAAVLRAALVEFDGDEE
ncbi:hypothetical protein [Pseudoxanthomonas sp.]|uniref:hypothetical protein n=1 Tax=Pseudoxanthomonas sp. TaxID=1871049 RepID=UPI00260E5D0F|nr:hypothetical protein [Pseudoxanthomonas sp.]WDS36918.1 MAG: hypothetical protein O8I58_03135 [Pseudoxanthomonas sp.]